MKACSVHPLEMLRAQIEAIEASGRISAAERLPFGIAAMDLHLRGGLAVAGLHEATGATASLNDDAAATLFTAGIVARLNGPVLWVLTRRDLLAPALAQAGLAPDRLLYAECKDDEEALAVAEEGLRHRALVAVVAEVAKVSMTASRRLQLASEQSGTMALLLRRGRRNGADPLASPSAAVTRWRIGPVPSRELAVAGIARPCWRVELVRQRGGPAYEWILEGTDEAGRLAFPAEPRNRANTSSRRERQARNAG